MWSYNDTNEDLLGYHVHARLLKDVILDSKMFPLLLVCLITGAQAKVA